MVTLLPWTPATAPKAGWRPSIRRRAVADSDLITNAILRRAAAAPRIAESVGALPDDDGKYFVGRRDLDTQVFAVGPRDVRRLAPDATLDWGAPTLETGLLADVLLQDLTRRTPTPTVIEDLISDILMLLPSHGWVLPAKRLRIWLTACGHVPRTWPPPRRGWAAP